tara:strand:+ start:144 stop:494 length:351 start_codon:yes stop_codon:yes gene_type:complete
MEVILMFIGIWGGIFFSGFVYTKLDEYFDTDIDLWKYGEVPKQLYGILDETRPTREEILQALRDKKKSTLKYKVLKKFYTIWGFSNAISYGSLPIIIFYLIWVMIWDLLFGISLVG